MPETTVPHKPNVRRFTHVHSFADRTQFVDLESDGTVYCVFSSWRRKAKSLSKDAILDWVSVGAWKEIPHSPVEKKEVTIDNFFSELREAKRKYQEEVEKIQKGIREFQETCKHPKTKRFSKYYSYCLICDKPLAKVAKNVE